MDDFKARNREGVKELQKSSKKALDLGTEMTKQADRIKSVVDSIHLKSKEDIDAVKDTKNNYRRNFDNAFADQVESAGSAIEQQGEQIQDSVSAELKNVRSGIDKLEKADSISDISKEASEAGREKLEYSSEEYERILSNAEGVINDTLQEIDRQRKDLGNTFKQ